MIAIYSYTWASMSVTCYSCILSLWINTNSSRLMNLSLSLFINFKTRQQWIYNTCKCTYRKHNLQQKENLTINPSFLIRISNVNTSYSRRSYKTRDHTSLFLQLNHILNTDPDIQSLKVKIYHERLQNMQYYCEYLHSIYDRLTQF